MPHVDLPQAEFKVVLLGDTFTGKTSLVLRFAEGYYRESARSATVGAFFITKRLTVPSVGLTCKIQIWDTAGQEQFKPLAPMYYQSAAAAICCFDPFHQKSIDTLKYWLEELHRNVPAGRIVIAMAACKCDLLQQQQPPQQPHQPASVKDPVQSQSQSPDHPHSPQQPGSMNISMNTVPTNNTTQATLVKTALANLREVEELAAHMGAIFVPTSAKTNDNVTELFSRVAERVLQFQKHSKFAADPATAIPVTLGGGTVHCRSTPSSPSSSPRTAHATAGSSSHRSQSTGSLLSNNNHQNSNGRTGSRSPIPSSLEQPSLYQSNQQHHAHQRSLSSSPTNIYGSMSRDDYLHRRNHHTSSPTPPMMALSNHNNNHSNSAIPPLPDSPTRLGLPKTSAAGMNESPILASGKATLYPAEEPPPPKGLAANLTASATLCGDTDYLNCAVMPHAGDHSMMMGKCCIL